MRAGWRGAPRIRAKAASVTADERHFEGFLAEFEPSVAALGRAAVAHLSQRLPSADVMVYDNYNFFVTGFSHNERPSEAVFSIVMSAKGVALCFLQGAALPDPHGILRGSGKVVRNVRLRSIEDFDRPDVEVLVSLALDNTRVPFDPKRAGRFSIRSVSPKKRPRRKPT